MKIEIMIEPGHDYFCAAVNQFEGVLFTTIGKTLKEIKENIIEQMEDFVKSKGDQLDGSLNNFDINNIEFEFIDFENE